MRKFEGILFVTDLDGTLLREDKSISKKNLDAIRYFQSEGGVFTFATGRIPAGAKIVSDVLKPNGPCGCSNGGVVYDFRTGEFLWCESIHGSVVEFARYIDKEVPGMGIEINLYDKICFCKKNPATEKHRTDENLEDFSCHYNDVPEPFSKMVFVDFDMDNMNKTIELLTTHPMAEQFDFVRSDTCYYEVLPKNCNKGKLVLKIAEILNIDMKNTIAIGDNDNDISMLETAHIGIAVANASEKARNAANYITVSNEDDAIAKVIYDLDKGIIKKQEKTNF